MTFYFCSERSKINTLSNIFDILPASRSVEQGANLHINEVDFYDQLDSAKNRYHINDDYTLRWAAENGQLEVDKCLLEYRADSNLVPNLSFKEQAKESLKVTADFEVEEDITLSWS